MAPFCYYDHDPSGFCFLVQIRAFVIQTSNLHMKRKILVVVVKWRHSANGLFPLYFLYELLMSLLTENSFNELILSDFKLPGKYNVPYQINNLA